LWAPVEEEEEEDERLDAYRAILMEAMEDSDGGVDDRSSCGQQSEV
jgi:hypothetical protein